MRPSVIISTYEAPARLALVISGFARQALRDFELIVADDGSGPETGARIAELRERTGLEIAHVWQEHEGFGKCRILNRAIQAARSDYLVFTDGDCIPRPDFLATHARLAAPGKFLSGGRVCLSRAVSDALTHGDVEAGRPFDPEWLRSRRAVPRARDRLKLLRSPRVAALLDRLTPTRATWNGHNASAWKADLLAVNGFDERLGYGGEDRELGERLRNRGLAPVQVRHRAVCVHLEHDRGYVDPAIVARNQEIRRAVRGTPKLLTRFERWSSGPAWTDHGIVQEGTGGPAPRDPAASASPLEPGRPPDST